MPWDSTIFSMRMVDNVNDTFVLIVLSFAKSMWYCTSCRFNNSCVGTFRNYVS